MIPKIIHYCWFGRNPKPKLAIKCIKSWKKKCPDYKIIEWNEDNFDIMSAPLYVQQAYEMKKWAFVTDYVRLYAMVTYGGIYMDTDVEVVRSLDKFLEHKAFSGFEDGVNIPTGIMACEKDFPLFDEFLKFYDNASFINTDGSINTTTNVVIMTNICLKKGLLQNGEYQTIEDFAIYPKDVFCPVSYETGQLVRTRRTCTIHWFAGSWHSAEMKQAHQRKIKEEKIFRIKHTPNRIMRRLIGNQAYEKIRIQLKRLNK